MPAKWGSGAQGLNLPPAPTPYTAQITNVKAVVSQKLIDQSKDGDQFEFIINVWMGNAWAERKLWTSRKLMDPASIKSAQFVPKLMKLIRACGMPLPSTPDQAANWHENGLIGKQFGISVQRNPEDPNILNEYFVPLGQPAPTPAPAPAAAAPAPTPDPWSSNAGGVPPHEMAGVVHSSAPAPAPAMVGAPAGGVAGDADLWK